MKAIIITILLIILGLVGYNVYSNWSRFNAPNYHYAATVIIDVNHPDKKLLLDYYKAIEQLNGNVITAWTTQKIDVRHPESDTESVLAAVAKYRDKLAVVKFYEAQLLAPKKEQILETKSPKKKNLVRALFNANPKTGMFNLGDKNALIFETQKLLNAKGATIKEDGVYRTETQKALAAFEQKNKLFVDGKLDAITLDYLLQ